MKNASIYVFALISLIFIEISYRVSKENDTLTAQNEQLKLNDEQTIGDIINSAQFGCAMMINDEDEPTTFDGLSEEPKSMCKTLDNIELYPNEDGVYFFSPSSGIPR